MSTSSKPYLRWYEDKLVDLYETAMGARDPEVNGEWVPKWWYRLIPGIIDPEWWSYHFTDKGDPGYPGRGPLQSYRFRHLFWIGRFICRWQHHPSGPIFFNANGYEPDGRCKDCGEEIT